MTSLYQHQGHLSIYTKIHFVSFFIFIYKCHKIKYFLIEYVNVLFSKYIDVIHKHSSYKHNNLYKFLFNPIHPE